MAAGNYSITVTMDGFASFVKEGVRITAGQALTVDAKLAIQTENQTVQVSTNTTQLSVDSDSNASSTVIKGADLDALSDDPDELSAELSALAGPAAGPNGGQIYIDGFTGGQLPPKSSIREIRINQNPFSAQYDRLGFGRVEIFTKPGTDKFHGSFQLQGNDNIFNTGSPFVTSQPPYHTLFFLGNLTGPINSKASFTLSGTRRDIDNNNLINGTIYANPAAPTVLCQPADPACTSLAYAAAVNAPQTRWDISPRVDLALSDKNTLTVRLQYTSNTQTNNGSGFNLSTTGATTTAVEPTVQISDTQIISSRVINEVHLEYQLDKSGSTPVSTAPAVSVQGSFNGGGTTVGPSTDRSTHVEVQNYTSIQLQKNFIRFGGRLRYNRDANAPASSKQLYIQLHSDCRLRPRWKWRHLFLSERHRQPVQPDPYRESGNCRSHRHRLIRRGRLEGEAEPYLQLWSSLRGAEPDRLRSQRLRPAALLRVWSLRRKGRTQNRTPRRLRNLL